MPSRQDTADPNDLAWTTLERMVRELHAGATAVQPALDAVLATAVTTIDPAQDAGVILLVNGTLTPQATTGSAPHELDALQHRTGVGPCIDAAREQTVIQVDDLTTETRWPGFGDRAVELGVLSMLCVPLWSGTTQLGTLSLYSPVAQAFSDRDVWLTRLFAVHAALALAGARRTEQFSAAVQSRDVIGQAKGILMERRRLTADDAFQCLVLASQAANLKLAVIAEHLVGTGELIGIDVPPTSADR